MSEISSENLISLYKSDIETLSPKRLKGFNLVISKGLVYYGILSKKYKQHFKTFSYMHKRCKNYKSSYCSSRYVESVEGFINFIIDIGPVPDGMVIPSIGRKDHSIGYVPGNFGWQSKSDNSRESGSRTYHKSLGIADHPTEGKVMYNDGTTNYYLHPTDSKIKILKLVKGRVYKKDKKITCPHCGKVGGQKAMKQWHFDNCKLKLENKNVYCK